MASKAIIMVNTDVGKEQEIINELMKIPEVKDVYLVYGIHDIVVVAEADDMDKLRDLITNKIRRMDGVKSTLTSVVVVHKKKE